MARGRPRKTGKRDKLKADHFLRPTEARETHNSFRPAGAARRVVPPIEQLHEAGQINDRQFNGLSRYADVAMAAERSPIRSSVDFSIYGTGEGLPHFGVRMNIELGYLEQHLGSLRDIARAICVEEKTLSGWAMLCGGSVMREKQGRGEKIYRWYEPRSSFLERAAIEIRAAGNRLADAIGA